MEEILNKMSNLAKAQRAIHKDNWKQKSRERLDKIVKTKMTTLMIGSLDAIEKAFGELWNDGAPVNESERQCQKEWLLLRQTILDLGNKQIRAMQKEIQQYDVEWNKYSGIGQLTGGNDGQDEIYDKGK